MDDYIRRAESTRKEMAALAGVSTGKLTESMRDQVWAKERGKRAYAPDLDLLDRWAKALKLSAEERQQFVESAHLEHATPFIRDRYLALINEVKELHAEIRRELDAGGT